MKKIGCITFHASHNYGSNLQAYALQEFINDNYDCSYEIINLRTYNQMYMYNLCFNKKNFKSILKSLLLFRYKKNLLMKYDKYENFINNRLNITNKTYRTLDELKKEKFLYDCFISGSDQIWNLAPKDFDWSYYLEFAKNCKKISYAASFGPIKQIWSEQDIARVKKNLNEYNYISVREEESYNNVKKLIGKEAIINVDPTMLLTENKWNEIINEEKFQTGDYIFFYDLKNDKKVYKMINQISKLLKLPVVVTQENSNTIFSNYIKRFDAGPEDFLNLIKNAKLVLSTSFHGNVFSIIFKKPFFAVNGDSDYRINTLLKTMNLDKRTINNENFKYRVLDAFNIDFKESIRLLDEEIRKSRNYLDNSINDKRMR